MGADSVIGLAVLGLVGCAMILVSVLLDYVKPLPTSWTFSTGNPKVWIDPE